MTMICVACEKCFEIDHFAAWLCECHCHGQSAANASTTDPLVPEQKETPWFVNAAKLIGDGSRPNFSKHPGRVLYALRAQ